MSIVRWILLFLVMPEIPASGEERPSRRHRESISDLIQQLGDPRYVARQRAGRLLLRAGEPALPALREALNHPDPEVQLTAKSLLQRSLANSCQGTA